MRLLGPSERTPIKRSTEIRTRDAFLLLALTVTGCAGGWAVPTPPPGLSRQNLRLADRIAKSPHGLFRFVNRSFAAEVCERFTNDLGPVVNLHGDAHIEQYAVTDLGRGLTDFDDAARGSAAIDLMRMAVSLHLTCDANGYGCESVLDSLWRGYAETLESGEKPQSAPSWVLRTRAEFTDPRATVLDDLEKLMQPIDDPPRLNDVVARYQAQMRAEQPSLGDRFLTVKSSGRLSVGVGSALDEKYLLRVEGLSAIAEDDLFLEIKEVRDLSGISCLSSLDLGSPLRVLRGEERISYTPYNLAGYVMLPPAPPRARAFWVHEWADHYVEAEFDQFPDIADLEAIAYDIGAQLALGHPRSPDPAVAGETTLALREWFSRNRVRLGSVARSLADSVREAWSAL